MNRKVLFRAYAMEEMVNSQWLEGFAVYEVEFSDEYAAEIGRKSDWYLYTESGTHLVYPESIGQYAYREDSNGDRLFEGDYIIEEDGDIGVIKFVDDGFKVVWYGHADVMSEGGWNEGRGQFDIVYDDYVSGYDFSNLTRSGNVFENKEIGKLVGGI